MKPQAVKNWAKRIFKLSLGAGIFTAILYHGFLSPVEVDTHRVERGIVVARTLGTGTLQARVEAFVGAEIQGRIDSIHADEGEYVAQGELLAQLNDDEPAELANVAEAELMTARAASERMSADYERAQAMLKQASRHYERIRELRGEEVVSQSELDQAEEKLLVAKADAQHAQAAQEENRRRIEQAERELDRRRATLDYARIHSPFNGLIIGREREPGDMAVPGGTIFHIVDTDIIWVSAWVDETEISRLKPGQKAEVVFRSLPESRLPGHVVRLGRRVDRETREFLVDVAVETLPEHWAIGQRAEVYIETERREAVTALPRDWVSWKESGAGVYIEEDGKATWQPITLGLQGAEVIQVIEGLEEGDEVVRARKPQRRVTDIEGQRIAS